MHIHFYTPYGDVQRLIGRPIMNVMNIHFAYVMQIASIAAAAALQASECTPINELSLVYCTLDLLLWSISCFGVYIYALANVVSKVRFMVALVDVVRSWRHRWPRSSVN